RTRQHLEAYRAALAGAREVFGGPDPFAVVTPLRDGLDHLLMAWDAAGTAAGTETRAVLERKIVLAERALLAAAGVTLDVRAADDMVTPGQSFQVTAYAWNGGPLVLQDVQALLALPPGWRADPVRSEGLGPDGSLSPGALATWVYGVTVPSDARFSRLYYLRQPREGAWYRWPDEPELWGLPRDPAPLRGAFSLAVPSGDRAVPVRREVPGSFVGVNPARGEYRRPLLVVPAVSVAVSPAGMVWPQLSSDARALTVSLRAEAKEGSRGTVRLVAPTGWTVSPAETPYDLGGEGGEQSVAFQVRPANGLEPGEHTFRAEVVASEGGRFDEGFSVIDYEHIERAAMFAPAEAKVSVVPVRVAEGLRVGYVMGTGDDGAEAIRQLGVDVTLLDAAAVRAGDFGAYDVVVLGVRAYETRGDLRAATAQLLEFARKGGTVLVQYNQYDFPRGGYTPYPVDMGRPAQRVSEEDAAVTLLQPDAPVFTTPNEITQEDFAGWVQERGLYFLSEWDDAYVPLLEMHDQDEEPTRGSLLVAPVGDGLYVYAALSFFRQWSAGVPGAYRLWANLLSLKGDAWRAFRPISD
ncbi:MAG: hypothetical protein Q8N53_25010, partial [Longimicrobiales bacterium]|nr:hypothetical protein [Longimicrobiales bacterium]